MLPAWRSLLSNLAGLQRVAGVPAKDAGYHTPPAAHLEKEIRSLQSSLRCEMLYVLRSFACVNTNRFTRSTEVRTCTLLISVGAGRLPSHEKAKSQLFLKKQAIRWRCMERRSVHSSVASVAVVVPCCTLSRWIIMLLPGPCELLLQGGFLAPCPPCNSNVFCAQLLPSPRPRPIVLSPPINCPMCNGC